MTPAEHYAEAERLLANAWQKGGPEGDVFIRTVDQRNSMLLAGIGHALLAQVRPDDPTGCLWERPADDTPAPVPEGCEGMRAGRRWPQDHAGDVTVVGEVLTAEPGPEVAEVVDKDGDNWRRLGPVHWECRTISRALRRWDNLNRDVGPLRAVSPR